jgi:poly(A) polymerase
MSVLPFISIFPTFAEKLSLLKDFVRDQVFDKIGRASENLGCASYVVGGYVRDQFLGRKCVDIDIVTVGSGINLALKFAESLPEKPNVTVFKNFGTAMVNYHATEDWKIEFVGARKESYRADSRKPVVENGTLEDDLNRRDFTINALAISLEKENYGELIDPFGGIRDMRDMIIRTPLDPDVTFSDDPLRMMRAIRFAAQLHFTIEEGALESIRRNAGRIKIVSKERIIEEINKIVLSERPSEGFLLLESTGLLQLVFPQMQQLKGVEIVDGKAHKDNFYHTLKVLDNLATTSNNLWLRWAAILHDIAKPATKKFEPLIGWTFHGHEFLGAKMVPVVFSRLKLPLNEKMRFVQKMVLLHLRPIALVDDHVSDSALRRLLFDAGEDIDELMLLCEADITSKNPDKVRNFLKNFQIVRQKLIEIEQKDRLRNWQPPVTGEVIMEAFGLKPGKAVGDIKAAIREAILEGTIKNDFEEAYAFMIMTGKEMGLTVKQPYRSF